MAKLFYKILFILTVLIYVKCEDPEQCTQESGNHCTCHFQDKSKIDISQLFPKNKDTPENMFLEADKLNYRFFFHGCYNAKFKPLDYNITLSHEITNSTEIEASLIVYQSWVDQKNVSHGNLTILGQADQIHYHVLPNLKEPYELIYRNKDGNITAAFRLICENYEKPYIQIIDDPKTRQFTLNSPYACLIRQEEESSTGATILLILLFICLIYFVGGGCILYFARGARGVELIPNIDFWRRLPGLVKDGTVFLFSGCNSSYISSAEAYDRI